MAYDQRGLVEIPQEVLQQNLGSQIEKVGRLVEHQQVRIVQQERRQLDTGLPTTR